MKSLAEKIAAAVSTHGVCVIDGEDLSRIWHHNHGLPDHEKWVHVVNLANALGLHVHIGKDLSTAIFRNPAIEGQQ